jgi:breast cancer 2 susceptibility protein
MDVAVDISSRRSSSPDPAPTVAPPPGLFSGFSKASSAFAQASTLSQLRGDEEDSHAALPALPSDEGFRSADSTALHGFSRASTVAANHGPLESDIFHLEEARPRPSSPNPFLTESHSYAPGSASGPPRTQIDSAVSGFSKASGLPGFSAASGRTGAALLPSAAALAKAQRMMQEWDHEDSTDAGSSMMAPPSSGIGFSLASAKGMIMPSSAALAKAELKRKAWDAEILDEGDPIGDDDLIPTTGTDALPALPHASQLAVAHPTLPKPGLLLFGSSLSMPLSQAASYSAGPSRSGYEPATPVRPSTPSRSTISAVGARPFATPLASPSFGSVGGGKGKSRAFKSPLLPSTAAKLAHSPLNPDRTARPRAFSNLGFRSAMPPPSTPAQEVPIPSTPLASTPHRPSCPSSSYATPPRSRPGSKSASTSRFVTPFKPGMSPGDPGRLELARSQSQARATPAFSPAPKPSAAGVSKGKQRDVFRFFDLSELPWRKARTELNP